MTMKVTCKNRHCENAGIEIEVPDGPATSCGPCGAELAPQAVDFEPPPVPDPMAELLERIKALEKAAAEQPSPEQPATAP